VVRPDVPTLDPHDDTASCMMVDWQQIKEAGHKGGVAGGHKGGTASQQAQVKQ